MALRTPFTIVTPNYNMGRWLGETIESVLANLQPGDEYIIVDGGSTDDSTQIIRSYERHLTWWVSEPDSGYADALAKGFSKGTAPYQCWINSGDLLLPGALDMAARALDESDAGLIYGDDLYIDDQSRVIAQSPGRVHDLKTWMLYGGWTPLQDACFWRQSLYQQVGGLQPELKYAADYALFLRMACLGKSEYVPVLFSAFRRHQGQKSIAGRREYRAEREAVRQQMLDALSIGAIQRTLLGAIYWTAVRVRARVTAPFYRGVARTGQKTNELRACRATI